MYRIIPLRMMRRTAGVKFDELVPSDIPSIQGIDRVIHGPRGISPAPVEDITPPVKRPWYMHTAQDDNLLVLQGTRYVDIFDGLKLIKASFVITPDQIFKNNKLYYDGPAMLVWPAGIFHRIISGDEGSISVNFATRTQNFDIRDNFNVYKLCTTTGEYTPLRNGFEDQPDYAYTYPNKEMRELVEDSF